MSTQSAVYTRNDEGTETILRMHGNLDINTAPQLTAVIDELVAQKTAKVTVNLEDLDLIDSSGVAAIVAIYKRVRAAGGQVSVTGARDQPLAIFKLLRMDRVFQLS